MMLGFKRRFAPYVEDGTKTHTIRGARRSGPPKVGELLHCYVDPRQKTMRLLGRFRCVRVQTIAVEAAVLFEGTELQIRIDGVQLSWDEKNLLAWRDGFRDEDGDPSLDSMMDFWSGQLPFVGHLIHWRHSHE